MRLMTDTKLNEWYPEEKNYAVIIGLYNGIPWLTKIIDACINQTIKPEKIFVWINYNPEWLHGLQALGSLKDKYKDKMEVEEIFDHDNHGVYSRFAAAFLQDFDRYLVLDDDTIPGSKFVENCYKTLNQVESNSILGYRGIRLKQDVLYDVEAYEKGTKEITEVNLVGHAWFVTRQHILAMFEDRPVNYFNGEDTHISAINQIKYGTKTYVPKQLISEPQTWGSTMQHLGAQAGRLSTSLGCQEHFKQRQEVNQYWISRGWKIEIK